MVDYEADRTLEAVQRCVVEAKNLAAAGEPNEELLDLTDYLIALLRSDVDETAAFDDAVDRVAGRFRLHVIRELLTSEVAVA